MASSKLCCTLRVCCNLYFLNIKIMKLSSQIFHSTFIIHYLSIYLSFFIYLSTYFIIFSSTYFCWLTPHLFQSTPSPKRILHLHAWFSNPFLLIRCPLCSLCWGEVECSVWISIHLYYSQRFNTWRLPTPIHPSRPSSKHRSLKKLSSQLPSVFNICLPVQAHKQKPNLYTLPFPEGTSTCLVNNPVCCCLRLRVCSAKSTKHVQQTVSWCPTSLRGHALVSPLCLVFSILSFEREKKWNGGFLVFFEQLGWWAWKYMMKYACHSPK